MWRCYLAEGIDATSITTLEEQDAWTNSAGAIASAAVPDVGVPEVRSASSPAMPSDLEDWMIGDLVEIDKEARVGVKPCLCNLQILCCTKKRRVSYRVSECRTTSPI